MVNHKQTEPIQGVLTERMDVHSPEFNTFQAMLLTTSRQQTKNQKNAIEIAAITIQMEDYLKADPIPEPKSVGIFLNHFLTTLNIRQNKLATYLNIAPSNLNKIIKGERQINSEFALKIGKIFGINPMLLLKIQLKNELSEIEKYQHTQIEKYTLQDLIGEGLE